MEAVVRGEGSLRDVLFEVTVTRAIQPRWMFLRGMLRRRMDFTLGSSPYTGAALIFSSSQLSASAWLSLSSGRFLGLSTGRFTVFFPRSGDVGLNKAVT